MDQPSENQSTLRAVVHGRVQGVGFRQFVIGRAARLHLDGSVRNQRDGTVEVQTSGPRSALDQLVEELRKGPPLSRVTNVDIEWDIALPKFHGFDVSY